MRSPLSYFLLSIVIVLSSCTVSFKNTSISPAVKSFYIGTFEIDAFSAPPTIGIIFSESLRDKLLQETRLEYQEVDPHLSFTGSITRYDVETVAPQQGLGGAINRLEVAVKVDYENVIDEDSWTNTFTFYTDFDRNTNLADVEDQLIEEVYDQILEDIFNKAFSNW